MPSGCVYEMFSDNAKSDKTYIGSTTGSLRARLASHKYARHPIFAFGDADGEFSKRTFQLESSNSVKVPT